MSVYLRRRVLARLALGGLASACGVGFLAGFEAVAGHRPVRRELLYEPRPTPSPTPVPTPTLTPTPAPITDSFEFVVQMPARGLGRGLKPRDFKATSKEGALSYSVVKTRYISDVKTSTVTAPAASVALVFDQSGSISGSDPQNLRLSAGVQFLDIIPDSTRVATIAYGDDSVGMTAFGAGKEETKRAIQGLANVPMGGTATYGAIRSAIQQVASEPKENARMVICFTDGQTDDVELKQQVIDEATAANVKLWFIALGNDNFSPYAQVARATGGALLLAQDADELSAAFQRLANKVVKQDNSLYELTVRATKQGSRFAPGQTLAPSVAPVSGKLAASTYQVKVP